MSERYEPTGTRHQRQPVAKSLVLRFVKANKELRNTTKQRLCDQVANVINYNQSFVFGPTIKLDRIDVRRALTSLYNDGKLRCGIATNHPFYDGKHYAVMALR